MHRQAQSIDARLLPIMEELVRGGISLGQAMGLIEEKFLAVLMHECGGNITQASRRADVHRNTLHNRVRGNANIEKLLRGIRRERGRRARGERA